MEHLSVEVYVRAWSKNISIEFDGPVKTWYK